jgi:hypothetical protein
MKEGLVSQGQGARKGGWIGFPRAGPRQSPSAAPANTSGWNGPEMIELYHCFDARSFRALWALEEMGLDYHLHLLPFPPRILQPDYLEKNPLGTIPLLIDGDVRMTESVAIPQYLETRHAQAAQARG